MKLNLLTNFVDKAFTIIQSLLIVIAILSMVTVPLCERKAMLCHASLTMMDYLGIRGGWGFWGMFRNPPTTYEKTFLIGMTDRQEVSRQEICVASHVPLIDKEFCQRYMWRLACSDIKRAYIASFCSSEQATTLTLEHHHIKIGMPSTVPTVTQDDCFVSCV